MLSTDVDEFCSNDTGNDGSSHCFLGPKERHSWNLFCDINEHCFNTGSIPQKDFFVRTLAILPCNSSRLREQDSLLGTEQPELFRGRVASSRAAQAQSSWWTDHLGQETGAGRVNGWEADIYYIVGVSVNGWGCYLGLSMQCNALLLTLLYYWWTMEIIFWIWKGNQCSCRVKFSQQNENNSLIF